MATALARPTADSASAPFAESQGKSLLRFITCGSVDDGKSTLIGRLLYDSNTLFEDQIAELHGECGTEGGLDLASLVDGLAAEREQGITIDVAYRFFATARRKFIVADTPGHEHYTRNMVTGASTAELAVILVDARKGVLTQTRRHSCLALLLGIRKLVLAVNKMDLVGYDRARFEEIVADYRAFAGEAGIGDFTAIPLSGLTGDNFIRRSRAMPWYDGPALLEHLERVKVADRLALAEPFRMAVQWVNRPDQDFRGYAGRIASGCVRVGDSVAVLPAGRSTTVARIVAFGGDLQEAVAGQSITLTFADEIDCSRGDLVASPTDAAMPASRLQASLVWMADEALVPHRAYWLKIGAATVTASIAQIRAILDVDTMERRPGVGLALNQIGEVTVDLDRPVPPLLYSESRKLGGFILIDKISHATVAAGLVTGFEEAGAPRPTGEDAHIVWVAAPTAEAAAAFAARERDRLKSLGRPAFVVDGTALAELGIAEPAEMVARARALARLVGRAGVHVLVAIPAPTAEAHPGRRIDAAESGEGAGEWVI